MDMNGTRKGFHIWSRILGSIGLVLVLAINVTPASAATVTSDISVASGSTLTISASGFTSGERLSTWASSFRGTVYPTSGTTADSNGKATIGIHVRRFWEPGWWAVTVHGISSGREAITTFQIMPSPPNGSIDVSPTSARPGMMVNFHGTGFNANDSVQAWVTAPNQTVSPLNCTTTGSETTCNNLTVSATGEVWFSFTVPAGAQTGTWYVTAYGAGSDRVLIGSFTITS